MIYIAFRQHPDLRKLKKKKKKKKKWPANHPNFRPKGQTNIYVLGLRLGNIINIIKLGYRILNHDKH